MENVFRIGENSYIVRDWLPETEANSVFILIHGLGAHSGRWKFFGEFLAKNGVGAYALELRGFGETNFLVGHIDSFNVYFSDIQILYDQIKKKHPGKKIFLAGESLGALIVFLLAARSGSQWAGLICFSPAFKNRMKFSLKEYLQFFWALAFFPKKQFKMPFSSEMCTRDTSYQSEMDASWRETRLASAKMLLNILMGQIFSPAAAKKIFLPVLFLLAGTDKDRLVDPAAARNIFQKISAPDKTLLEYPEMYHALSIELGRERVFADILDWCRKRNEISR